MDDKYTIGQIIKKYIFFRNKTIRQTAEDLGFKKSTFDDQLNKNILSADTLFRLAKYLDIDLNWVMAMCEYQNEMRPFEREIVPRMNSDFREKEKTHIEASIKYILNDKTISTDYARKELLKLYGNNVFYLLDVLVPDDYEILVASSKSRSNKKAEYFVDAHQQSGTHFGFRSAMMYGSTFALYDSNEALNNIIEERKNLL